MADPLPKQLREFEQRTQAARARLEPHMRAEFAAWDALHRHIDGGGSPSMLRALSLMIGRIAAETLPPGVNASLAYDCIIETVAAGMNEVLTQPQLPTGEPS